MSRHLPGSRNVSTTGASRQETKLGMKRWRLLLGTLLAVSTLVPVVCGTSNPGPMQELLPAP